MFERFSEAARLAMFGARLEVTVSASPTIEPEHLLLGLMAAPDCLAARLVQAADLSADEVRTRLLSPASTPTPFTVEVPFGSATKKALEVAVAEADAMSSEEITTGHLLLALIRDEHTPVSRLLRAAGLRLNDLRVAVQARATAGPEVNAPGIGEMIEARIRQLGLE